MEATYNLIDAEAARLSASRKKKFALVAATLAIAGCVVAAVLVFGSSNQESNAAPLNLASATFSVERPQDDVYALLFKEYVAKHGRTYTDDEYAKRQAIFIDNMEHARHHNVFNTEASFKLGATEFADMTNEEFRARLTPVSTAFTSTLGLKPEDETKFVPNLKASVPDTVNWQGKAVGNVVNQDRCGSCWTFATTGALEGALALKTGKFVELSKQELVDCDMTSSGCKGTNNPAKAFAYVSENGIASSADYPYTSLGPEWDSETGKTRGTCMKAQKARTIKKGDVTAFQRVDYACELCLKYAVAQQPVAVVINAGTRKFQLYTHGVVHHDASEPCDPKALNHAVLAVGYGVEDRMPFWLIKNSWGSGWGAGGYIKLFRTEQQLNKQGSECGVATFAQLPLLGK
eukprot:GILK01000265.1.p1 GENE.GILK01000265.1~~GILK01000265.1.p1  ORF type:complete len:404 (-),score=65.22 GILK01000265.1:157-1368(-)